MTNINEQLMAHFKDELRPRRRGVRFWSFALLALLVLLVIFAPTLLTRTSARDYLVAKLLPRETAIVTMRDLQIGWFTPLAVADLRVLDGSGQPLLEVDVIQGNRSLTDLILDAQNLGQIAVTNPTVHLQLRPDGSNLEDTLAKLAELSSSSDDASMMAAIELSVTNARVAAVEMATGSKWTLDQVDVQVNMPADVSATWIAEASGMLNGKPFQLHLDTPLGQATNEWPLGPDGHLKMTADSVSLEPLRYAALRSGQPIEALDGSLSMNADASWKPVPSSKTPELTATAVVRTDDLQLVDKPLLGDDVLRLATVYLNIDASIVDSIVRLQKCDFRSDFGAATLSTVANVSEFGNPNAIIAAIRKQQLTTAGQIDVAALSRTLPNTMKIRDDVQLASGQFGWNIQSEVGNAQTRWTGAFNTSNVKVLKAGKPIDWQFPLEVNFAATDGAEITLETLTARSDFFSLAGNGTLRQGTLQAKADLERLTYQLSQVIDTNNIYVRGDLQSYIQWSETRPNELKLDARNKLVEFVMTQNEQVVCEEQELTTMLVVNASLDGQTVSAVNDARLDVVSKGDYLVAEVREAVAKPDANSAWPLVVAVNGELQTWLARLKPFGLVDGWDVSGTINSNAQLTASASKLALHGLTADVRELRAVTDGISIIEPVVQLKTAGNVDMTTFACQFPTATVASQTFAANAQNVSVELTPNFVVAGDIGYQADIQRLMDYMPAADPEQPATQQFTGRVTGQMRVEAKDQTSSFHVDGNIDDLQIHDLAAKSVLWQEPTVHMVITGQYDAAKDQLSVTGAKLEGQAVNMTARGSATQLTGNTEVDLQGEYGYDLAGLSHLLVGMLGPDITFTGAHKQPFTVRGPIYPAVSAAANLVSDELVASSSVSWQSANAYNIPLGPARIDAQLENGILRTNPVELAVGEGIARFAPTVHVNTEPMWMTLQPQTVADRIRITPVMTSGWMKYIAPLLADATSAESTFSITLARAQIPLMQPMESQIEGQFVIHGGTVGPGPMATQFIDLASQIKRMLGLGDARITDSTGTWVQLAPQQVAFQITENRVYHEGLEIRVDGVPVRTRGSVGLLDDSISVMAEVPIMDDWIAGTPALAGLRGQVISIPIGGTTSRPQLDQRALAGISTQLARSAATGYIQSQLGGRLQDALGGGNVDEAVNNAQDKLNNTIQNEIGKQLNKLFK